MGLCINNLIFIIRLILEKSNCKRLRSDPLYFKDQEVWETTDKYLILQSNRDAYDPANRYLFILVADKPKYKEERTKEALKNRGFLASRWPMSYIYTKFGKDMVYASFVLETKQHFDCKKEWIREEDIYDQIQDIEDDDCREFDDFLRFLPSENDPKVKKNTLIEIGRLGVRECFLNVPREKAIERYCKKEGIDPAEFEENNIDVNEIKFNDNFGAYDVFDGDCDEI